MLASDMKFGFFTSFETSFTDSSDSTDSTILKNAVRCPYYNTCLKWATHYHNISSVINDFNKELWHAAGIWTYENNRLLACEFEYGGVENSGISFWVSQGSPNFVFINDVIGHTIEGGTFIHIRNMDLYKMKLALNFASPSSDDTYYAINVSHLQTAFYLLMLGYVLAVACFVSQIMWHRYRSQRGGPTRTSVCHRQTYIDTADRRV
jgi:hypothetical protein